jgi:hypothetical protein
MDIEGAMSKGDACKEKQIRVLLLILFAKEITSNRRIVSWMHKIDGSNRPATSRDPYRANSIAIMDVFLVRKNDVKRKLLSMRLHCVIHARMDV